MCGPISRCCGRSTVVEGTKELEGGRFSPNWRIIPAVATVAVCIVGIVTALMWNSPYLTIPFGVGILMSLISMYYAYHYHYLKSYGENNEQFSSSVEELELHNEQLKSQLEQFQKENGTLQNTNEDMKTREAELRKQIEQYQKIYEQQAQELIALLEALKESKQGNDATWNRQIQDVRTTLGTLNDSTEKVEGLAMIAEKLQRALEEVNGIIQDVKKNGALSQRLQEVSIARSQLDEATRKLSDATKRLTERETKIALLDPQVTRLETSNNRFAGLLDIFLKCLEKLGKIGHNDKETEALKAQIMKQVPAVIDATATQI